MDHGWIKLHRKMRDNPLLRRPAYRAVWIEILLEAEHGMKSVNGKWMKKSHDEMKSILWKGDRIVLKPGQLTMGAKQMSEWTGVPRGTVERIIKSFVRDGMIEEQTSNKFSLITVKKWEEYQQNEEQMRNKRGTNEEQMRTPQECKNEKNEKNKSLVSVPDTGGSVKVKRNQDDPMTCDEFVSLMRQSARNDMKFIGEWADTVRPELTTYGQWQVFLRRHLKAASQIQNFTEQQISTAFGKALEMSKHGQKFQPTIETLIKILTA